MECVAVFLLLFVGVITAAAIVIANGFRNRRGRRRLFRQLARQFTGACDSGGLFSPPVVRMRYGDTWVVATESRAFGPFPGPGFQVRIAWPHARVRCEIIAGLKKNRARDVRHAWPPVKLNDDSIDKYYSVYSPDELEVRQLLSSGVNWQLERLRELGDSERLYVLIRDGQIVVQKHWRKPRGDQPEQFLRGVLGLYDQCMIAKAIGIEFLRTEEAQTLDHVTCMVCGDEIQSELVYCQRCKTPHHEECWKYAGACSVYGCRETNYQRPLPGSALATDTDRQIKKPR